MHLAAEVYEASVIPRNPDHPGRRGQVGGWVNSVRHRFRHHPGQPAPAAPVVADIVVVDLRSGAERVEISVTGAEVTSILAKVHEDLDTLSVESFDEVWGLV